ncbi:redoxin domain-containing protein [Ktedonosporobacter rubrisoli]|uniref:Redoxin domain-containing protein n=1 Tax=Ktedonosporobacter rubrisoli TaxID=2509675 RepID=A0A4P6JIC5_KTERU|nr:redoxin domain-containing protein [Ktedonosporobacter rubrisoli]QBD74814.1 redoxin domain-containing protein [Ktedonosporobacter rubrisoli]
MQLQAILLVSSVLLWIFLFLNLLLTLALVRRYNRISTPRLETSEQGLRAGTKGPDFKAFTLDGASVSLADYSGTGRANLFIFSAPGCQPCHDLLATLKPLQPQIKQSETDLIIVSDGRVEQTRAWAQEMEIPFTIISAPRLSNPFFQDYKVHMTPSYCLLNSQSVVESAGLSDGYNPRWTALISSWSKLSSPA